MNFKLKSENNNNNLNILNISLNKIEKRKILIFKKYYEDITFEKEKIDKLENSHEWDKIKKIGNPYELIYTSFNKKKKKRKYSNLSTYQSFLF